LQREIRESSPSKEDEHRLGSIPVLLCSKRVYSITLSPSHSFRISLPPLITTPTHFIPTHPFHSHSFLPSPLSSLLYTSQFLLFLAGIITTHTHNQPERNLQHLYQCHSHSSILYTLLPPPIHFSLCLLPPIPPTFQFLYIISLQALSQLTPIINPNGTYSISVGGEEWLSGAYTKLYLDGKWYSSDDHSLTFSGSEDGGGYVHEWMEGRKRGEERGKGGGEGIGSEEGYQGHTRNYTLMESGTQV
jgi:hypothetical protein